MKRLLSWLGLWVGLVSIAAAQSYHHPVYLVGGYGAQTVSSMAQNTIYLYDKAGATPRLYPLCATPLYTTIPSSLCMDWDNKNLLICMDRNTNSLHAWNNAVARYDVATSTWTSLWRGGRVANHAGPISYKWSYPYNNVFIDQNGDALFSIYSYDHRTSPTTVDITVHAVYKYDQLSGMVSTVMSTVQAGIDEHFYRIGKDIDSGRILIAGGSSQYVPNTMRYAVHTLNPEDGYNPAGRGFWNDGSVYGWSGYSWGLDQNVRNGYLERPYYRGDRIYQLKPGTAGMTTIATITTASLPYTYFYGRSGRFDLQTAARPDYLLNGYHMTQGMWIVHYDVKSWSYTSTDTIMTPVTNPGFSNYINYQFEIFQSRNIQTVYGGPNRWAVLFSVPNHAGKTYMAALSLSGVRPGIPLPDGRRINLNPDLLTVASLNNQLPFLWNPGPLVLDARGEARASLDIGPLHPPAHGFGIPVWIAMAVLDPAAPQGFAFLPDTYVMRI